ncbi:SRPBCC family protein [Psychrobacillus vulpis]|uniref:SRPBCC family protein n=1 Tax=Psychrobacillus vulpis TaxID=2325572 RepID=A0A544TTH9_9BACI|nr:SRPBCC family protein [Psychrobacillus vulpis]TQR20735.1 SRPBCC family protein [Psychrobacillus vulpis]
MKKWRKEIIIQAPIDFVWPFFYGDIDKKKMIFPKVMDEVIIQQTDDVVGSIILQTYQNGSYTEQYELTIKKYGEEKNYRMLQESFLLNNRFRMTTEYELESRDDTTTKFTYTSINKPKNILLNVFQLFGSDEVVQNFMNRTKETIENAYEKEKD